jgi:hypothetical protein
MVIVAKGGAKPSKDAAAEDDASGNGETAMGADAPPQADDDAV